MPRKQRRISNKTRLRRRQTQGTRKVQKGGSSFVYKNLLNNKVKKIDELKEYPNNVLHTFLNKGECAIFRRTANIIPTRLGGGYDKGALVLRKKDEEGTGYFIPFSAIEANKGSTNNSRTTLKKLVEGEKDLRDKVNVIIGFFTDLNKTPTKYELINADYNNDNVSMDRLLQRVKHGYHSKKGEKPTTINEVFESHEYSVLTVAATTELDQTELFPGKCYNGEDSNCFFVRLEETNKYGLKFKNDAQLNNVGTKISVQMIEGEDLKKAKVGKMNVSPENMFIKDGVFNDVILSGLHGQMISRDETARPCREYVLRTKGKQLDDPLKYGSETQQKVDNQYMTVDPSGTRASSTKNLGYSQAQSLGAGQYDQAPGFVRLPDEGYMTIGQNGEYLIIGADGLQRRPTQQDATYLDILAAQSAQTQTFRGDGYASRRPTQPVGKGGADYRKGVGSAAGSGYMDVEASPVYDEAGPGAGCYEKYIYDTFNNEIVQKLSLVFQARYPNDDAERKKHFNQDDDSIIYLERNFGNFTLIKITNSNTVIKQRPVRFNAGEKYKVLCRNTAEEYDLEFHNSYNLMKIVASFGTGKQLDGSQGRNIRSQTSPTSQTTPQTSQNISQDNPSRTSTFIPPPPRPSIELQHASNPFSASSNAASTGFGETSETPIQSIPSRQLTPLERASSASVVQAPSLTASQPAALTATQPAVQTEPVDVSQLDPNYVDADSLVSTGPSATGLDQITDFQQLKNFVQGINGLVIDVDQLEKSGMDITAAKKQVRLAIEQVRRAIEQVRRDIDAKVGGGRKKRRGRRSRSNRRSSRRNSSKRTQNRMGIRTRRK